VATYKVKSRGVEYTVTVVDKATGGSLVTVDGREFDVKLSGDDTAPAVASRPAAPAWKKLAMASSPVASEAVPEGDGRIVAPISGTIISLDVEVGDSVSVDQVVLRLEAMKNVSPCVCSAPPSTVKSAAIRNKLSPTSTVSSPSPNWTWVGMARLVMAS